MLSGNGDCMAVCAVCGVWPQRVNICVVEKRGTRKRTLGCLWLEKKYIIASRLVFVTVHQTVACPTFLIVFVQPKERKNGAVSWGRSAPP
jgi:hypothetical protein